MTFHVQQVHPGPEPALGITRWDYADSFEIRLGSLDDHAADVWLRTALAQAGPSVRRLSRLIHRHVLRFDLDATDRDGILGWRQLVREHDVAAIQADGTLLRALIVARRHEPTRFAISTYLVFHRPTAAPLIWLAVRPVHLQVEHRLLVIAARALTSDRAQPLSPERQPTRTGERG